MVLDFQCSVFRCTWSVDGSPWHPRRPSRVECHQTSPAGYQTPPRRSGSWKQKHQQHPIDELVQERSNSSALAMELWLSCTNPSISARKKTQCTLVKMWWVRTCYCSEQVSCKIVLWMGPGIFHDFVKNNTLLGAIPNIMKYILLRIRHQRMHVPEARKWLEFSETWCKIGWPDNGLKL